MRNSGVSRGAFLRRCLVVAVAIAAFVPLVSAGPAAAHEFDLRKTDNKDVVFSSDEGNTADWSWWNHFVHYSQFDQYDARTDLAMRELPRGVFGTETDVIWWAAALPSGLNGDERCVRVVWYNGRCESANIRYNESYTGRVPWDTGWYLACHEFGHAYGLDHLDTSESGCMTTSMDPYRPPGISGHRPSQHMIDHINAQY